MSRQDRYILTELIPPFLFGMGAFLVMLIGVSGLYEMLKLIFRMGFPAIAAFKIFALRLPGTLTLTLPMAMMFGSLMSMARLSGDGELTALRAGGASLLRIGVPVIIAGLVVSASSLCINELLVPPFNDTAFEIAKRAHETVAGKGDMLFEVRDSEGRLERILYGRSFDAATSTVSDATIMDFTRGDRPQIFFAAQVRWQGDHWVLEKGEHTWWKGDRPMRVIADRMEVSVGGSPDQLRLLHKRPEQMSLTELSERSHELLAQGDVHGAGRLAQRAQIRLAMPWSSLGFAMLGLPLGIRKTRSSRGIGMGMSLVVIFGYYAIMHTLSIVGEHSAANHTVLAWGPNVLLYLAGIGLLLRGSR